MHSPKAFVLCFVLLPLLMCFARCSSPDQSASQGRSAAPQDVKRLMLTVADILGDSNYLAIAYGGYRMNSRDIQPSWKR